MSRGDAPLSLLWVVPKWPLPARDGARVATVSLLRGLAEHGTRIHLWALVDPNTPIDHDEAKRAIGVAEVTTHAVWQPFRNQKARILWSALSRPDIPVTMSCYASPRLCGRFQAYLSSAGDQHDAIVFDGLHGSMLLADRSPLKLPRIIYRAHNVESDLWSGQATKWPRWHPAHWFLRRQAELVERQENELIGRSSVATLSADDLSAFRRRMPGAHGAISPCGFRFALDDGLVRTAGEACLELLFLGKLDWLPNREGLAWFLRAVWPPLRKARPNVHLTVVGSGDAGKLEREIASHDAIKLVREAPKLDSYFSRCHLLIAPLFSGSGTRVKIIEAAAHGRATLATRVGMAGLDFPLNAWLHADAAPAWIEALTTIDSDECAALGRKAYDHAKARFDQREATLAFLSLIDVASMPGTLLGMS